MDVVRQFLLLCAQYDLQLSVWGFDNDAKVMCSQMSLYRAWMPLYLQLSCSTPARLALMMCQPMAQRGVALDAAGCTRHKSTALHCGL